MRKNKKLFGIFLIIAALVIMQLPKSEADAATSASDFKINNKNVLTGYSGSASNITIPDTVEEIGEGAFEEKLNITKITIPKSVKKIGAYAFWGCDNLESVILGTGLERVDDYAFANCKGLKSISIPKNIKSIGIGAFSDCVNMTDITILPEVTNIHDTAFDGCYKLIIHAESGSYADNYAARLYEKQLEMPEYEDASDYNPDGNIDNNVIIPPTDNPQADEPAGNVIGSTHVVGNQAVVFIDNSEPRVYSGAQAAVPNDNSSDDTANDNLIELSDSIYPKYTIVDNRIIADMAYYKNDALTEVSIPGQIEEIGEFAYARSSVVTAAIPEGVKTIEYGAFYHCDNLTQVSLPATLESVAPNAFVHSAWVDNFLNGADAPGDFLISGNTLVAYRGNADEVHIPDGVTLIAGGAFKGHGEINSVFFPSSLRTVGEGAFENCASLGNIVFSTGLVSIKDRAFAGCNLNSLTLPVSLQNLGLSVFDSNTEIFYSGNEPTHTHELSAMRLSNEGYRNPVDDGMASGVTVTGMENASAYLEGAGRHYTLSIRENADNSNVAAAYTRCLGRNIPDKCLTYDLSLTDNSNIEITKLGKQYLIVMLPLSNLFEGEEVEVVTIDRNGQLESVQHSRVSVNNSDYVRIVTAHLSPFVIIPSGNALDESTVITNTSLEIYMSEAAINEGGSFEGIRYQWILGGIMLLAGVVLIFHGTKYFV